MKKISKKYIVNIPKDILIIYSHNKRLAFFKGFLDQKLLNLKVKIYFNKLKNLLLVSQFSFFEVSNNQKKTLKALQGSTIALIKQIIVEISMLLHKKLKLVGVGFKLFLVEVFKHHLLQFKLGYSHLIYLKITNNLKIDCFKATNLFVSGNSYRDINQIAAKIRLYKTPDSYKGKGILYENETVVLKEGKKI